MMLEFEQLIKQSKTPPKGYGIVPFYWWNGEPLTKERLREQLKMLAGHSVSGVQINYAHSAEGGNQFGKTYENEPKLFSDAWWELLQWFLEECKKYDIKVSLSDYTLSGVGQGWYTDRILDEYPGMHGQRLILKDAYQKKSFAGELERFCYKDKIYAVCVEEVMTSIHPIHPETGKKICEYFFDEFEQRTSGKGGIDFDFFFSDELNFGIDGWLYHDTLFEAFYQKKGYSLEGHLQELFLDTKPTCYQTRMDYHDVMVALEEECYFAPIYEWHEKRNMTYGCDHGSRGYDVTEFGSYFQTQKYNQAPGCDQPNLQSDIVKNKVASSIAHVNCRKRVWLEGFYGSGWGTTAEELTDAIARNFIMGQNLLSLHGMYYTTYGGWWEWAPPCNCFRMPYWKDLGELTKAVERMSYLLSQGHHVCHAALYYPIEDTVCGFLESQAVEKSFEAAREIYRNGIDFDFLDEKSLLSTEIKGNEICLGEEAYQVVVLPPMNIIREQLVKKLLEAAQAGVSVYILQSMPQRTETAGGSRCLTALEDSCVQVENTKLLVSALKEYTKQDLFIPRQEEDAYVLHRKIGTTELFMIYGVEKGTVCTFQSQGIPYLWNPFTGGYSDIQSKKKCGKEWKIALPLSRKEIQIILFDTKAVWKEDCLESKIWKLEQKIPVGEWWNCFLMPTRNNRYGDFSQPPSKNYMGAQVRSFWYYESEMGVIPPSYDKFRKKAGAQRILYGYGTKWLCAGPFADEKEAEQILLAGIFGDLSQYHAYEISERFGIYGDPGEQGYHGLKGRVDSDFLVLGERYETLTGSGYRNDERGSRRIFYTNIRCERKGKIYILTGDRKPYLLFVDGKAVEENRTFLELEKGYHSVFAAYNGCGRTHLIFAETAEIEVKYPLSMKWYQNETVLPMDAYAGRKNEYGIFGFQAPPGLKELHFYINAELRVWINGSKYILMPSGSIEKPVKLVLEEKIDFEAAVIMQADYKKTNGYYEGAVFEKPIDIICEKGVIHSGDWAENDGLSSYSGTVAYEQTIQLQEVCKGKRYLFFCSELVSTVRMFWNGRYVGTKVCPPWEFEVTDYVISGDNHIRMEISNTLANQYETIPTRYQGSTKSGLMGNCEIQVMSLS